MLTRAIAVTVGVVLVVTSHLSIAQADGQGAHFGTTVCGSAGCDLSAAQAGVIPAVPGTARPAQGVGSPAGGGSQQTCASVPKSDVLTLGDGHQGLWYELDCGGTLPQGAFGSTPLTGGPMWADIGKQGPGEQTPKVDPAALAEQATSRLELPKPIVRMSPSEQASQVVGVPAWLWVERTFWAPVRSSAEVPGVEVQATATPSSVTWDLADGTEPVVCQGPGTPYRPDSDPYAASPDCGHTFARSSGGEQGGVFQAVVTAHWSVTWSGAGQSGTFPDLTTRAVLPLKVVEVQSLVVAGSGR